MASLSENQEVPPQRARPITSPITRPDAPPIAPPTSTNNPPRKPSRTAVFNPFVIVHLVDAREVGRLSGCNDTRGLGVPLRRSRCVPKECPTRRCEAPQS